MQYLNKIVLATSNKGKLKEFSEIFSPFNIQILSLSDIGFEGDIVEDGQTFEENSKIKAKTVFDFCNIPTLADDSGLEVFALGGEPGIYSARYSGENGNSDDNITKLLSKLENISDRKARFVCALTLHTHNDVICVLGECGGQIAYQREGTGGFGYDSVFLYNGISFGNTPPEVKNAVSHRADAINKLLNILKQRNFIYDK